MKRKLVLCRMKALKNFSTCITRIAPVRESPQKHLFNNKSGLLAPWLPFYYTGSVNKTGNYSNEFIIDFILKPIICITLMHFFAFGFLKKLLDMEVQSKSDWSPQTSCLKCSPGFNKRSMMFCTIRRLIHVHWIFFSSENTPERRRTIREFSDNKRQT